MFVDLISISQIVLYFCQVPCFLLFHRSSLDSFYKHDGCLVDDKTSIFWLTIKIPWWRHQLEPFSALLAICAGNSPVPGEFPTQRPVTRSFDIYFELRPNKRLSKQSWGWWFETPSRPLCRHRNDNQSSVWQSVRRIQFIPHSLQNVSDADSAHMVLSPSQKGS